MRVVGIDLAERWTGAVALDSAGSVSNEWVVDFGPAAKKPDPPDLETHFAVAHKFALVVARDMAPLKAGSLHVVVEDVSHFMVNPKPAIRVQAVVIWSLQDLGIPVTLVLPNKWQSHFGFKKVAGQTTKGWATAKCNELGYVPAARWGSNKQTTDLRDSYLIAKYGRHILGLDIQEKVK